MLRAAAIYRQKYLYMQLYLAAAWLNKYCSIPAINIIFIVQSQMSVWSSLLKAWHKAPFRDQSTALTGRCPLLSWMFREHLLRKEASWKATYAFTIPNVAESGFLQRHVDFNVLRSSATCLHQVQPEMGAVQDKGPPQMLQPRQRLCILLLSTHVALEMELNSGPWETGGFLIAVGMKGI